MRTIVVYYSLEGNTDWAAKRIASDLDAALLRLDTVKTYPDKGFKKFFWGGKSAVMAETPALTPYIFDSAAWDRVILGFPVWASNITPPIRTFVRDNDLKGKHLSAFACEGGSGGDKAFQRLCACLGIDKLEHTLILIDPKDRPREENDRDILEFCQALRRD